MYYRRGSFSCVRAGVSGKGQRERTGHKEHAVIAVPHTNLKRLIRDVSPSGTICAEIGK